MLKLNHLLFEDCWRHCAVCVQASRFWAAGSSGEEEEEESGSGSEEESSDDSDSSSSSSGPANKKDLSR